MLPVIGGGVHTAAVAEPTAASPRQQARAAPSIVRSVTTRVNMAAILRGVARHGIDITDSHHAGLGIGMGSFVTSELQLGNAMGVVRGLANGSRAGRRL